MDGTLEPFARLRLTGGRFDDGGMPVAALVELAAYQDLVVGVAKELYLTAHPDRQRVLRGFTDSFELRLRTVEEGSAQPVLERVKPSGTLLQHDEFVQARELIDQAVEAIVAKLPLPESFPSDALVLFNRFGQTLRPDEAIELRGIGSSGPVYTREVRRDLLLKYGNVYLEDVQDIGWVSEVDGDKMRCLIRLRLGPGTAVAAPLDELTFPHVKDVLAPKHEGPPVRISGVGVFDADRRLLRLDALHEVTPVDDAEALDALDQRLNEIAELEEGWLDGEGVPLDPSALQWARRVLADLMTFEIPRARVFATLDGGVQAEWSLEGQEVSITFEPGGKLYAIAVNVASGQAREPVFTSSSVEEIAQFVLQAS
ncbi:MAG: hypothetical protein ABSD78_10500 [Acidimicrobiales bacterium]